MGETDEMKSRAIYRRPTGHCSNWPQIILANPEKYTGLMRTLALKSLHEAGQPHPAEGCELCRNQPEVITGDVR